MNLQQNISNYYYLYLPFLLTALLDFLVGTSATVGTSVTVSCETTGTSAAVTVPTLLELAVAVSSNSSSEPSSSSIRGFEILIRPQKLFNRFNSLPLSLTPSNGYSSKLSISSSSISIAVLAVLPSRVPDSSSLSALVLPALLAPVPALLPEAPDLFFTDPGKHCSLRLLNLLLMFGRLLTAAFVIIESFFLPPFLLA